MEVDFPFHVISIAELPGHDDRAWHVSWNPVRPLLASCSADKSVRLYSYKPNDHNPESGIPEFSHVHSIPTGHAKTVRAVAWAPSGDTLATASFDTNIGIWEDKPEEDYVLEGPDSGEREWECMATLEGHETECKSVGFSSSGTMLASCSRDKTVWIWEVHPDAEFECMSVLMEHTQDVKCVAWHPTEEILASGSYDDTIKLYLDDPSDDWYCFSTLTGHTSTVWSLAWSPNGQYLASASDDRSIRVWKRVAEHQWECILVLNGHERSVYSVSWGFGKGEGEDGHLGWLASTSGDGKINVWELSEPPKTEESKVPRHKLIAQHTNAHGVFDVNSVSWCPRKGFENLLATAGDDGMARVWIVSPVPE